MKTKISIVTLFILLAVLMSACSPAVAPTAAANQRSLMVSGIGKVSLQPDIAYIYVGVHTEKATAAEAVAENNSKTQKLIDSLKSTGVDAKDIQTMNFSIWQNTQYGPDGKSTGSNYAVDNTVYLTVRNLENLGALLDAAVSAGANNINSIQFDVADKSKAMSEARAEAVKTAKTQAAELATAAGVSLGEIQSISYSDAGFSPILLGKGMGGGGDAMVPNASVPISTGQMEITVSVTVGFEIK